MFFRQRRYSSYYFDITVLFVVSLRVVCCFFQYFLVVFKLVSFSFVSFPYFFGFLGLELMVVLCKSLIVKLKMVGK
jgi:hypothetical protein